MAQQRSRATELIQEFPNDMHHPPSSNVHDRLENDVSSSQDATATRMSQSQTLIPSRGGTLKKRQSLSRKTSLKRGGSRKGSRPGSVRSLTFADDVDGHGSEMQSAFFTPVPTSGSPTEILSTRFQVWRKVLKDLISYFRDIQKSYDSRSKSLYTISNIISNISTPPQLALEGGISAAMHILRNFHKTTITESNKAKSIEEEVIQQLVGLRSDLGQKIKEIKGLSGDFKNNVDKETEATRRAVRELQDALGSESTDPKNDPYLVRLSADRQLARQIEEENYLHRAFLNLESSGRELESIVVGEIQKAYNAYAGILKREADEAYEAVEGLRTGPLAISKDYEWDAFVYKNEHFVDPRLPVRRLENITYPGRDDASASEVKAGMLERKSKYLKSYTPGWYVLSTTHLHEFKSPDRIASQSPVMSLPLADQKLGSRSATDSASHKFMLKGRQSGGLHRGHAWVFRAESYDTMLAWYEDIKNLTEKTGAERNDFIRRSHARSVSAGSHKAGSISSDGLGEDEADEVPYSATASQAEIPPQQEKLPHRPNPGGRFPSALNVQNRDSQGVPSSPSSSSDRDTVAAAGALPGSSFLHGTSKQQEDATDDSNRVGVPVAEALTATLHNDIYSATRDQHDYEDLSVQQASHPSNRGETTLPELPRHVQRHDSKYGDWMIPTTSAIGATNAVSHHHQDYQRKRIIQEEQSGLQREEAAPTSSSQSPTIAQDSIEGSVQGDNFTATAHTALPATASAIPAGPTASADSAGSVPHASDPAAPIRELAERPALVSHNSVATISNLPIPGRFP